MTYGSQSVVEPCTCHDTDSSITDCPPVPDIPDDPKCDVTYTVDEKGCDIFVVCPEIVKD